MAVVGALAGLHGATHAAQTTVAPDVDVLARYQFEPGTGESASEGFVTREGILARPLLRPGEVLETVPGMVVTQHSGDGKANQYFLRGYNLDHGTDFATWVAGMPVNQPTNAHGQGYTDLNFVIPELISGVLFKKGPYYAEDGDFASVGSARILYVDKLPSSIATLTGGSYGYARAVLAGSPEVGAGNLVYGIEYQHSNGPWVNPANFGKYNGVLRYVQGSQDNGFNVTAMGYYASWSATDQIPQRAVDAGVVDRFGAIDPTDGGSAQRFSLSGEWRESEGNVSRYANLYAVRSRLNLFSNFTYFLDDPLNGDQFKQAENRTLFGGGANQSWFTQWGGRPVTNTVGVQLRRDRLNPVALDSTRARKILSTTREDQVTIVNPQAYLSNTIEWTPWFRTLAGLRYDYFRFDVDSDLSVNSGRTSDSQVSPKLSVIFGPWAQTELFLNWGKGLHSNDARGTTTRVDPKTGELVQPVTPVVPTCGYEIGLRSQPLPGLTTTLALWTLTQDSELLFIGDAGTTEPSRASKRSGVEWLVQYAPTDWLAMDLALAFTRARFTEFDPAGDRVPGAPGTVGSAGITVGNLDGWFGSLRWRYIANIPLIEDDSVRAPSLSQFNGRTGYAFDDRWRAWLDVFNFFNGNDNDINYYYVSRMPGEPSEGIA
ncbi:MAG: TonB-dependent receptor, partial [Burkholderiales bacterium]